MFDFMDEMVEDVEELVKGVAEFAAELLVVMAKTVILLTTPVWIIPYKIIRTRKRKGDIEHE